MHDIQKFRVNYLGIIGILLQVLSDFPTNFCKNSVFENTLFSTFGKFIEQSSDNMLGRFTIDSSMHLDLLFRTVKTAALYLVSIKSYSKNIQLHSLGFLTPACMKKKARLTIYYYDDN